MFAAVISFELCVTSTLTPINLGVSILALDYVKVIELIFHEQSELVAVFLVSKPKKLVIFATASVAISSNLDEVFSTLYRIHVLYLYPFDFHFLFCMLISFVFQDLAAAERARKSLEAERDELAEELSSSSNLKYRLSKLEV